MMLTFLLAAFSLLFDPPDDNFLYHHAVSAKSGDGAITLLSRYHLANHPCNLNAFYELNQISANDMLYQGKKYVLPVLIYKYNGQSIRSTIKDDNYDKAVRIKTYNENILAENLRTTHYSASNILWVPYHEIHCEDKTSEEKNQSAKAEQTVSNKKTLMMPVLGRSHQQVHIKSEALAGQVFYLISGHGGPDPGAVGKRGKYALCEDEYAYDVTLRLFELLLQQGAQAYLIVEDKNDGIRDGQILPCDRDETCHGAPLPLNQAKRLRQRVEMVNNLYLRNQKKGVQNQTCISIHVDSRSVNHKQDVFFCHYPTSTSSKQLASSLKQTFAEKYRKYRKGGEYRGAVSPRSDLFVLKNTFPKAVLVELANIQNKSDHRRILQPENRQALAKWMLEGILSHNHQELASM